MAEILLNFFDNIILAAAVEEVVPAVGFFKDRYFPTGAGDIFKADKVITEYRDGDRKLAAFVAPRVGDIPMTRRGYEITSIQPAYIAPSRLLTLDELTKRGFGEAIYPGMDEQQRAARLLVDDMADMDARITRREEWMAAQTMINNGCDMVEYIDDVTQGDTKQVRFFTGEVSFNLVYSSFVNVLSPKRQVNLTFRVAQQAVDKSLGYAYKGLRIVEIGRVKEFTPGKIKAGEGMEAKVKLELTYLMIENDGEEIIAIDKLNGIYRVQGEDMLADVAALI